jgi:three-Cys-motif partner protein
LYAGNGTYPCSNANCGIGNPDLKLLKPGSNFSKCIPVVKYSESVQKLRQSISRLDQDGDFEIISGNCISETVMRRLFDLIPRSASSLALLDPPGYSRLRWTTIKKLAAHGTDWQGHKTDLLITLPLEMALIRNLLRPECEASITRLFGNLEWLEIKQAKMDQRIGTDEVRTKLVELFMSGLKSLGYKHVFDAKPLTASPHPFYHVILASDTGATSGLLKEVWSKPRYLPCELFHGDTDTMKKE